MQELESNLRPSGAASPRVQALRSVGRLDPATVVKGTRVTIVGEVSGAKTDRLDDVEYRYPIMIVKHLHVWPVQTYGRRQPGPSIEIFGGMGVGGGSRGGGGFRLGF